MAVKRMLSNKITDSDSFKDMSLTAQALYFHFNMSADDEGFLNNSKSVLRSIRASDDDMQELCDNGFVICFGSGVVVITHWNLHNKIQPSRLKTTLFTDERKLIYLDDNKIYRLVSDNNTEKPINTVKNDNVDNLSTNVDSLSANADSLQTNADIGLGLDLGLDLDECSVCNSSKLNDYNESAKSHDNKAHTAHSQTDTYESLCKEYGKDFVDERIERSRLYRNTDNMHTVAKWCKEDADKAKGKKPKNKSSPPSAQGRQYSKEELSALERKTLCRGSG